MKTAIAGDSKRTDPKVYHAEKNNGSSIRFVAAITSTRTVMPDPVAKSLILPRFKEPKPLILRTT